MTKNKAVTLNQPALANTSSEPKALADRPVLRGCQAFLDLRASESISSLTRKGAAATKDTMLIDRKHGDRKHGDRKHDDRKHDDALDDTVAVPLDDRGAPQEHAGTPASAVAFCNDVSDLTTTLSSEKYEQVLEDVFRDDDRETQDDVNAFLTTFLNE